MNEKELAKIVESTINDYSFNPREFAANVMSFHPTLQQTFARLMKETFLAFAEKSYFDARNKNTVQLAKEIKPILETNVLPFI